VESSQTSPALALQFSAVVTAAAAAAVVVSEELAVVVSDELAAVVEAEEEEQAPLTQDSPVAQGPEFSLQVSPDEPPDVPYWQYQSVVPSQAV